MWRHSSTALRSLSVVAVFAVQTTTTSADDKMMTEKNVTVNSTPPPLLLLLLMMLLRRGRCVLLRGSMIAAQNRWQCTDAGV